MGGKQTPALGQLENLVGLAAEEDGPLAQAHFDDMGRRHFHFGPAPRAQQASLAEAACRVVSEDCASLPRAAKKVSTPKASDSSECSWAASRRLFPAKEAVSSGATMDSWSISPKRHCEPPPITDPRPSSVRRTVAYEFQPSSQEEEPVPVGRRHLPPPPGHLFGAATEVVRDDMELSSRRRCMTPCQRPRSAAATRRREMIPPQKRHLQAEDHLLGCEVLRVEEPAPRATAKRDVISPTFIDQGPAIPTTVQTKIQASSPPRPDSRPRGRRYLNAADNFVGWTLRGAMVDSPTPVRARRFTPDKSSMFGGCVRSYPTLSAKRPGSASRPKESLIGGIFRETDTESTTTS